MCKRDRQRALLDLSKEMKFKVPKKLQKERCQILFEIKEANGLFKPSIEKELGYFNNQHFYF